MSFLTFLDELWRKKEKCKNFQKNQKSKILIPYFWTPQIMNIRIALAHVHPCTKFGVPRFKGVRARGQKAEKIKLPPGGTILTPRGWFSSFRRSGASNEPSLVRIGPAVPALFIGHLSFTNSWRHEVYQLTTCPQGMIGNWNISKTI